MKPLIFLSIIILCSCNMTNENVEGKVYPELSKAFEDTLKAETTSTTITRMELEITGNLKGKGKLFYSHVPFVRKQFIEIEGNVNKKIETDWYDERCLIIYEPENTLVKGEIIVNFKVY
jgi:hypothetical protein